MVTGCLSLIYAHKMGVLNEKRCKNAMVFNGDISRWDVSSVNNMQGMFSNSEKFNQHLSKWNVSNVMDMSFMFENATAFKPSDTQNVPF